MSNLYDCFIDGLIATGEGKQLREDILQYIRNFCSKFPVYYIKEYDTLICINNIEEMCDSFNCIKDLIRETLFLIDIESKTLQQHYLNNIVFKYFERSFFMDQIYLKKEISYESYWWEDFCAETIINRILDNGNMLLKDILKVEDEKPMWPNANGIVSMTLTPIVPSGPGGWLFDSGGNANYPNLYEPLEKRISAIETNVSGIEAMLKGMNIAKFVVGE